MNPTLNTKIIIIKNNEIWEVSNTVEKITIKTSMYDTAGRCDLTLINNKNFFPNGSIVNITVNDTPFFYGYIFNIEQTKDNKINIVAYDQLRYLKNKDTIYFENKTATQIFEDICKKNNLKYKIIDNTNWIVLGYLHDNKTMFEIIKHSIDETTSMTNKRYMIRDNFGVLEFIDVANQKTNLQIGTKSILTDFNYNISIDDDTYNVIKLIRDNEDTNKRDVWQVQDSDTIKKWGKLQFLYKVDEQANEEQIKELANNILKVKNRETRKLNLSALGFYNLKAGDGVKVVIDNIIDEWFYLSSVTTNITNNKCMLDLEVFIM